MILFAWTLAHDGARSLLVFLVPFAVLNCFLLYKLTTRQAKRRRDRSVERSSELEMDDFKAFCAERNINFILVPSG